MPITFQILSKKRPSAIYIRFREGRATDARARTKLTVNPEDWSSAKGKAKENNDSNKAVNYEIELLRQRLIDRLNKREPSEQVTTEWLKAFVNPSQVAGNSLLSCFDRCIEVRQAEVAQGLIKPVMMRRYRLNRGMVARMLEETGSVQVDQVNLDFIQRYRDWCHSKKYAQTTTSRSVKFIITVCRFARQRGIPTHKELDYIKEKTITVKHIYLTFDELEKISAKQLPDYLDNARDWLLISCYTGQRVSDFQRFTRDMLKEEKGKTLLEFTQVKTKKIMTIPVHEKVKAILAKRNGDFPRQISDQRYNDYIKEVCRLAGITEKVQGAKKDKETNRKKSGTFEKWELVSSHIGRRSFASNFFGQIPTSLLMFVTGHTTEAQFYAYIGKSERTKAFQLAEYF